MVALTAEAIQDLRSLYEELLDIADEGIAALGSLDGAPASVDLRLLTDANDRLRRISRLILATQDEEVRSPLA